MISSWMPSATSTASSSRPIDDRPLPLTTLSSTLRRTTYRPESNSSTNALALDRSARGGQDIRHDPIRNLVGAVLLLRASHSVQVG